MTEPEWLSSARTGPMLELLIGQGVSRKLLLFNCACCRRIWHLLTDERSREMVVVAEAFAYGLVSEDALSLAGRAAAEAALVDDHSAGVECVLRYAAYVIPLTNTSRNYPTSDSYARAGMAGRNSREPPYVVEIDEETAAAEEREQAAILRDIFGNPFRSVAVDPSWPLWNNSHTVKLAQTIYEERAFDRLPMLGDALEAAGIGNPDMLAHCRSPGEHVRGCWVVDLLLGKQ